MIWSDMVSVGMIIGSSEYKHCIGTADVVWSMSDGCIPHTWHIYNIASSISYVYTIFVIIFDYDLNKVHNYN